MLNGQTKKCQSGQNRGRPLPCVRQRKKHIQKIQTKNTAQDPGRRMARSHRDAVRVGLGIKNAAESSGQRTDD